MIKVKPSQPDLKVPDPKTGRFIPAEGKLVDENSTYWHRRIVTGDVVIVEEAPAPAPEPEKKPAKPAPKQAAKQVTEKPTSGGDEK